MHRSIEDVRNIHATLTALASVPATGNPVIAEWVGPSAPIFDTPQPGAGNPEGIDE